MSESEREGKVDVAVAHLFEPLVPASMEAGGEEEEERGVAHALL